MEMKGNKPADIRIAQAKNLVLSQVGMKGNTGVTHIVSDCVSQRTMEWKPKNVPLSCLPLTCSWRNTGPDLATFDKEHADILHKMTESNKEVTRLKLTDNKSSGQRLEENENYSYIMVWGNISLTEAK